MTEKMKRLADSALFRRISLGAILTASILIGVETFDPLPAAVKQVLAYADRVLLAWFVLEISLRILAFGKKPHLFFKSGWNLFDFLIVAVSVCPAASPAFAAFRLFRVFRVLRLISSIPDLQILTGALLKSLPSMGYVGLLLFLIVYVYGVLGVHLFRLSDPLHFGNLGLAFLSLFQIITLEGWAEIFRPQLAVHGWPVAVYFISFILLGTMILLNLLIGVVLRSMEQVQTELIKKENQGQVSIEDQLKEVLRSVNEIGLKIEKIQISAKRYGHDR